MELLLVSATDFEIRPLLLRSSLVKTHEEGLWTYRMKTLCFDVLIPGVGMVQTAYALGRRLALKRYDLAVNAGIAGSFRDSLAPGTIVNVVEDCVAELGAEEGEKMLSLFDLGLADPDEPPYRQGKLFSNHAADDAWFGGILGAYPKVRGVTSNTVHGSAASIGRIRRLSDADIESMEGAAFFFACMNEGVPCLQIRSVSNMVEERDKSRWRLDLALENLNRALWEILHYEDLLS